MALFKYSDFELDFMIYEEQEGKTGANLDREKYKELMNDITSGTKTIHILLVYKLDRLTRSVQDFTEIYKVLSGYGTEFISVKEEFDTTTPMGRAMLTITVVFAQLEREVIAERIQDSLIELAKTGRWLGGMTPFAYSSQISTYVNDAGQGKSKNHLEVVLEEAGILQKMFRCYLEFGSLSKVEAYFLEKKYKTRNDLDFRRYSIKFILSNPVYCCADFVAYEYFKKNGYSIYAPREGFSGDHGIMAYNKTLSIKNSDSNFDIKESRWKKKEDWIIAVGEHQPLILSKDWIKVQRMMEANKEKSYRFSRTTDALLSGVLKCKCGCPMRPKTSGNKTAEGEKGFYYLCEMKERSKGTRCKACNIDGNVLDKIIIHKMTQLEREVEPIYESFTKYKKTKERNQISNTSHQDYMKSKIDKMKRYLENINRAILKATNQEAIDNFTEQYQLYLCELNLLQSTLNEKRKEEVAEYDQSELIELLSRLDEKLWCQLSYVQKKYAVKELIEKIDWDGKKVEIFFKGSERNQCGSSTANLKGELMNC